MLAPPFRLHDGVQYWNTMPPMQMAKQPINNPITAGLQEVTQTGERGQSDSRTAGIPLQSLVEVNRRCVHRKRSQRDIGLQMNNNLILLPPPSFPRGPITPPSKEIRPLQIRPPNKYLPGLEINEQPKIRFPPSGHWLSPRAGASNQTSLENCSKPQND